ncbi:hypothetical protein [Brevundimonas nasdae]|uniref:hypothetical protein n=1 Tax=Brevundimonas nasdae TaxID=172043 RepID=UPI003F68C344
MVAYSFKGQFEPRIQACTKQQTIRAVGKKRHTLPGERMTLTTGDRFHPRLIGEAVCQSVVPIQMDLAVGSVLLAAVVDPARLITTRADLDAFAVLDGFECWADLVAFWKQTHPTAHRSFAGLCISWGDTFKAAS